jgi:predicted nucleic acid-binding protein
MYLLEFSLQARSALLQMIEHKAVQVLSLETKDMPGLRALMSKYSDLPMDFADATLVHMANQQGLRQIFTLDRRDFSIYRLNGGRAFTIIPTI